MDAPPTAPPPPPHAAAAAVSSSLAAALRAVERGRAECSNVRVKAALRALGDCVALVRQHPEVDADCTFASAALVLVLKSVASRGNGERASDYVSEDDRDVMEADAALCDAALRLAGERPPDDVAAYRERLVRRLGRARDGLAVLPPRGGGDDATSAVTSGAAPVTPLSALAPLPLASDDETPASPWSAAAVAAIGAALLRDGYCVVPGAFGRAHAAACGAQLEEMTSEMKPGAIVAGVAQAPDQAKRGDVQLTLRTSSAVEGPQARFARGTALRRHAVTLDRLRTSLEEIEADASTVMLATYPGDGAARYVRHRDASPPWASPSGRKVTALYYVNGAAPDQAPWDSDRDGGALLVWAHAHAAGPNAHAANEAAMVARYRSDAPPVEVSPDADVLVLFNSYLEHEVLPCRRARSAVTVWMSNRRHLALELLTEAKERREARARDARDAGGGGQPAGAAGGER